MGIDIHALNFLKYSRNKKEFGDTLTIGRQGIHVNESLIKKSINAKPDYKNNVYCEELLTEYFGAKKVESIDNSAYEGATHIHNMNDPIPQNLAGRFDTVFDGGCLEHIFNIPQALKNCSLFCKPGGQIIHVLPANNFCGHGFWQFSPELFFSLYSKENGYIDTEVFVADTLDANNWYQVKQPTGGQRVNITSLNSLHVLVRTILIGNEINHSNVQQSDYIYEWNNSEGSQAEAKNKLAFNQRFKQFLSKYRILSPFFALYRNRKAIHVYLKKYKSNRRYRKNQGLSVIEVKKFVDSK